jgi:hypothetical protein
MNTIFLNHALALDLARLIRVERKVAIWIKLNITELGNN